MTKNDFWQNGSALTTNIQLQKKYYYFFYFTLSLLCMHSFHNRVNNYAHLQIFYMIWVITRAIKAIGHNRCALRVLLVLLCALGTISLGTTALSDIIYIKTIFCHHTISLPLKHSKLSRLWAENALSSIKSLCFCYQPWKSPCERHTGMTFSPCQEVLQL